MGCCGMKKWLKILAGLALIYASYLGKNMMFVFFDPWMIVGLYLLLRGLLAMFCQCDCCKGNCEMGGKKKR